jgi:hypothetical protein
MSRKVHQKLCFTNGLQPRGFKWVFAQKPKKEYVFLVLKKAWNARNGWNKNSQIFSYQIFAKFLLVPLFRFVPLFRARFNENQLITHQNFKKMAKKAWNGGTAWNSAEHF